MSATGVPSLGIVWVHYRTPELVAPSVAAVQADLEGAGLGARLLLVDNGSSESEREPWRALPIERLDPGENLGYAGALALAVAQLETPFIVVLNPDVCVRPGCLRRLVEALENGAAAAGPRFHWDAAGRLVLPPTEERTATAELLAVLARRAPRFARIARRRWRQHALRHWTATAPLRSCALSGALLAFRLDAWNRIGPFDTAYRLYFEETDWLERVRRAGLPSIYDPRAEAHHLYAQSSLGEPAAAGWFAQSAARFRRRRYGAPFAALLGALERSPKSPPAVARLFRPALAADQLPRSAHWIEIASSPLGFPAAAESRTAGSPDWLLPEELCARLAPGAYWVRAVEAGREIGPWRVESCA